MNESVTDLNIDQSRRQMLRLGLAGAGAIALAGLPKFSVAEPGRKFTVLINLDGGNDSLNTVIPLNFGSYFDRRPTIRIDTPLELGDGVAATTEFGLHPRLTALQQLYTEGSLALINKVGYPNANRSHFTSKDVFHTGDTRHKNARNKDGWVARYAAAHNAQSLGCVSIGYNAKALQGAGVNLFQARRLSAFSYSRDGRYQGETDQRSAVARNMLARYSADGNRRAIQKALQAGHDHIATIEQAVDNFVSSASYPDTHLGRSLEGVSQLVQADTTETDIYYTGIGGFDTHGTQGPATWGPHASRMGWLNDGLAAFVEDIKAQGRWQDCLIVVFSEFGRRNFENGSRGTDHGEGQTMIAMGGAINGGVYGAPLIEADIRDAENLPMEVDFRQVFSEVIENHLGKDSAPVFTDNNRITGPSLGLV